MQKDYHMTLILLGLLMGAVLGLSGFANFDKVHNMFIFSDLSLLFAFAGAVALSMLGFFILARGKKIAKKKFNKGTIPGSVMFGIGWAITGACPSIALVQVGQGQLAGLISLFGIVTGVWIFRTMMSGSMQIDSGVCGEE